MGALHPGMKRPPWSGWHFVASRGNGRPDLLWGLEAHYLVPAPTSSPSHGSSELQLQDRLAKVSWIDKFRAGPDFQLGRDLGRYGNATPLGGGSRPR